MAQLLGVDDVMQRTGLSRTTIWRLERDGEFPERRKIAPNRVAWRESEIEGWIESRPRVGDGERGETAP